MSQSKVASLIETTVNTAVGLAVGMVAQRIIYPLYGIHHDYSTDLELCLLFTLVSFTRHYILRRAWNAEWWRRLPRPAAIFLSVRLHVFAYASFNPYR